MIQISLEKILYDNIRNENFSINLIEDEIIFIHNLVKKNESLFNKIEEEINKIDNENKIDYHDIPEIVILISEIYQSYIIEESIENISLINIVQFTLDSIFDLNLVSVSEFEEKLIKKLIKSSIQLLKINPEIPVTNGRRIVDARNKIIHGYDEIENENIWAIVINHLPILKKEILTLVDF
jgi:uncharacterized protein YutE (UPF0331/DUF86 family)